MHGTSYSKLINKMNEKDIIINRKVLADLAVSDDSAFEKILKIAIN